MPAPDGADVIAPNAHRFPPLAPTRAALWERFPHWDRVYFPNHLGLTVEELRTDYCRMRLPYRPEFEQPAGVVHGGALATLVDTVVVPAVGSAYEEQRRLLTLTMTVQYLAAVAGEDAVAEGWVAQRGRSIAFCQVEVRSASGVLAVTGSLVYKVGGPLQR